LTETIDIIVSGHLCLDLIPAMESVSLEALPTPGRLFEVGPITIGTGGAVSNTGLALHRLGADVRLLAAVGDDLLGQLIIAALRERDPRLAEYTTIAKGEPSSYSVVLSPARSDRIFLHCAGANSTFGVASIDFDLLAPARIFHLGYPPILPRTIANDGQELAIILQEAKRAGPVTSLDMALPDPDGPSGKVNWPRILERSLPHVDIFLPSIEEIMFMLRRTDFDNWGGNLAAHLNMSYLGRLADELLDMGAAIAGFKLGELGFYVKAAPADRIAQLDRLNLDAAAWGGSTLWSPVYRVDVVSTVGAGDSAYAGFLAALLGGMGPAQAINWACAVGACNVEAADATSGVQSWEATQQRMHDGWERSNQQLTGA
jgi:sugar/nucleoside kinase (ribokinase family)